MAKRKPNQEVDQTAEQALWNASLQRRRAALHSVLYPPPLGLMPRKIHIEHRIKDILDACHRYIRSGLTPASEWINELAVLSEEHEALCKK